MAPKWKWLKRFGLAGLAGLAIVVPAALADQPGLTVIGVLLALPLIFWLSFIPIMHWRERYIGSRPNTWGALMVFETSGWTRLLYWFVHVLPDSRAEGAYGDRP